MNIRIGVDVGGTNTDCVLLNNNQICGAYKTSTTFDVISGIEEGIKGVIASSQIKPTEIKGIMIGTTHFLNAVLQRKNLSKVAVFRFASSATDSVPPFIDFPEDLKNVVFGKVFILKGGFEFRGVEIEPFDEQEVISACEEVVKDSSIEAIAISGVFSHLINEHELKACEVIKKKLPNIGENATILNASLLKLAKKTVQAFEQSLNSLGLTCPLYLTQNDGTLLSASDAYKYPILTFGSGPTNSMRGASFLSGETDAIVVDIGGTSTDVGVILSSGFPREAGLQVNIGGVNTNFRMPDVLSIALGGGSIVSPDFEQIGPVSVGYEISSKALVFGGKTVTATDIAVAYGSASIGDISKVKHLDKEKVEKMMKLMKDKVEELIDRVKTKKENMPVILVGYLFHTICFLKKSGGTILVPGDIKGASKVIRPAFYESANAVGAAIAQVSGSIDYVVSLDKMTREEAIEKAKSDAIAKAVAAGAIRESVHIVEISDIPLQYLPGNVTRMRAVAVGNLFSTEKLSELSIQIKDNVKVVRAEISSIPVIEEVSKVPEKISQVGKIPKTQNSNKKNGEWILSEKDIESIAIGAGIVGCGGGGQTYLSKLKIFAALNKGEKIRVISPESLEEDDLIIGVGFLGAPSILLEKAGSGTEIVNVVKEIEKIKGKQCKAILSCEIGGCNSLEPMLAAAHLDLPMLDADGMGRAFPEVSMISLFIYGAPFCPTVMGDIKGNIKVINECSTTKELETECRNTAIAMGLIGALGIPFTLDQVKKLTVMNSVTKVCSIGRSVIEARELKKNPVKAILEHEGGKRIFTGKVVDVKRDVDSGFVKGKVVIEGLDDFRNQEMKIDFQNENLIANLNGTPVITVPDLIAIVDSENADPIFSDEIKYGLRVDVLGMPCNHLFKTEKALEVVGPRAFKYNVDFSPIQE